MEREAAEAVAAEALAWLATTDDLLGVFMGSAGLSPEDLAQRAGEPEMLAAVLDFVLLDDAWVSAFCTAAGEADFTIVRRARAALPGGEEVSWT